MDAAPMMTVDGNEGPAVVARANESTFGIGSLPEVVTGQTSAGLGWAGLGWAGVQNLTADGRSVQ
jgi:hypothetical protein